MESKSVKLDISGMTPEQTLLQGPQLLQEIQLVARSVQSNLFANPDFKRLVILVKKISCKLQKYAFLFENYSFNSRYNSTFRHRFGAVCVSIVY